MNGRNPITERMVIWEVGPGRLMALIADPNEGREEKGNDGNGHMRCEVCGRTFESGLLLARHCKESDGHDSTQVWASAVIRGKRITDYA